MYNPMQKYIFFDIICGAVCIICLASCCNIPYWIPSESIRYSNSHEVDTLYYEASAYGRKNSERKQRCIIYQAIKTNRFSTLKPSNIIVMQNGEPLKFKLVQAMPHKWKRIKQKTSLPAQSLFAIDTKARTLYGDSIIIVERNYPLWGDSIVVRIKFDNYGELNTGIYGRDSEVGKMLPKGYSIESDANRYMFEMMQQMHNDSISNQK